jgi:hypothetical protein
MGLDEPTFRQSAPVEPELTATKAPSFDADALTRALRVAGAALVVASASTFMLEHWDGGNDLLRYAMLVGQSLLLAAAAYFVGLTMREGRSARTLLALVLATMPVSFAVLGGLVYSQFHLGAVPALPSYATWVAPSGLSAVLAVAGTLLAFVPLSIVSFVALARKEAKALTVAFLASNLLIIVPLRQPLLVAVLAGGALLALLRLELTRFGTQPQLATLEGKLARGMAFVAPVIMLGRVLHLYDAGLTFWGGLCLIAAASLWLLLDRAAAAWQRDAGAFVASGVGVLGWALCWRELTERLHCSGASAVLLWGLPAALLLFIASRRAATTRRSLHGVATFAALGTTLLAAVIDWGSIAALSCVAVGVAVAVCGAAMRALLRTVFASLVALFGLLLQVWLATHTDNVLRWVSLSVVGVLLIVASAYVDRNRARLVRFWEAAAARQLACGHELDRARVPANVPGTF